MRPCTLLVLFTCATAHAAPAAEAPPQRHSQLGLHHVQYFPTQFLNGVLLGGSLANLGRADWSGHFFLGLLGGAAGLGAAGVLAAQDASPAVSLGINSGSLYGFLTGYALAAALWPRPDSTYGAGTLLSGSLAGPLGALAGGLLVHGLGWSEGRVALVNTAWMWAGGLGYFLGPALAPAARSAQHSALSFLVPSTVALVAAGLLSQGTPVGRGEMLLVDLGGVLGLGVGSLVVLGVGWTSDPRHAGLAAVAHTAFAGMGLLLTGALVHHAHLRAPQGLPPLTLAPQPVREGMGLAAALPW